jgi:hypothetical protein
MKEDPVTLLSVVDCYLLTADLSASRFGREVANDPRLVEDMRRGRIVGSNLRRRILLRIDEHRQ